MAAIHRLRYFAADAWDECRHSPGVNLLALTTLTASLFLAGLVLLAMTNVESRVSEERRAVPFEVYLTDDVRQAERRALERQLAAESGVARVEYVDKSEALRRYREWAQEMAALAGELDSNPLPASIEVFLDPGPGVEDTAERLRATLAEADGVDDVRFDLDWLQRLQSMIDQARFGGLMMALVVFSAVVLVMASVLRLAVYARRDEIDIMLLVGATPTFVRGPFLVAGLVQGLVASAIALGIVEGVRRLALAQSDAAAAVSLVLGRALPLEFTGIVVLVGLVVSLTSAVLAVRRFA